MGLYDKTDKQLLKGSKLELLGYVRELEVVIEHLVTRECNTHEDSDSKHTNEGEAMTEPNVDLYKFNA